jgi:hypothetical protein
MTSDTPRPRVSSPQIDGTLPPETIARAIEEVGSWKTDEHGTTVIEDPADPTRKIVIMTGTTSPAVDGHDIS